MRRSMSKPAFPGSFFTGELLLTKHSEKITDTTHIPPPDWEALIEQIARQIVEERSPQRLLQVRASLYDLLSHCIDSTTIIKTLTWKLIPKTDDALKPEVIKWAAFYEHRCKMGAKQIFHLEAFVAKYMRIYERYVGILNMVFEPRLTCPPVIPWALILTRHKCETSDAHTLANNMCCKFERYASEQKGVREFVKHARSTSKYVHYVIGVELPSSIGHSSQYTTITTSYSNSQNSNLHSHNPFL
jgi:hypothetical protein